jgi:hypothetical protein
MNTLYRKVQPCEIILPLSSFVSMFTSSSFFHHGDALRLASGSAPSCFVFPLANRRPSWIVGQFGVVESSFALRSNGVSSRRGWYLLFTFGFSYTCDETFGPAMLMPMFVLSP